MFVTKFSFYFQNLYYSQDFKGKTMTSYLSEARNFINSYHKPIIKETTYTHSNHNSDSYDNRNNIFTFYYNNNSSDEADSKRNFAIDDDVMVKVSKIEIDKVGKESNLNIDRSAYYKFSIARVVRINGHSVALRVDIMKNRVWNRYLCNWKTGPKKVF